MKTSHSLPTTIGWPYELSPTRESIIHLITISCLLCCVFFSSILLHYFLLIRPLIRPLILSLILPLILPLLRRLLLILLFALGLLTPRTVGAVGIFTPCHKSHLDAVVNVSFTYRNFTRFHFIHCSPQKPTAENRTHATSSFRPTNSTS